MTVFVHRIRIPKMRSRPVCSRQRELTVYSVRVRVDVSSASSVNARTALRVSTLKSQHVSKNSCFLRVSASEIGAYDRYVGVNVRVPVFWSGSVSMCSLREV